jgi:predicted phosphodiesterase
MLIHLGDEINDALKLVSLIDIPVIKVPGNCDNKDIQPRELLESISGRKFFITHGDAYKVKNGFKPACRKGKRAESLSSPFRPYPRTVDTKAG